MNNVRLFGRGANVAARALAITVSVECMLAADATSVNIDWSARTTGQQACIAAGTSGSTSATLVITNANIILYTYSLNVKSYQLASNDGGLPPFSGSGITPANVPNPEQVCPTYVQDIDGIWADPGLFPKNHESIALSQTLSALDRQADAIQYVIHNRSICKDQKTETRDAMIVMALQGYLEKAKDLNGNPALSTISFPYQIDNTHYYVFTLQEQTRFNQKLTNATLHWKCGLDDTLTLSVGVMGTTLPYRTYTSQSVPSGTSTQNVLAVSGASGWTPQGLALLNYKLFTIDKGPLVGMAVSTGPVFKFGGTPEVSNFGWFAGVSVSLWRRLFITPGIHLGQFADFPLGFAPGSVIPANFGTLTPVTRWSGKFGIGITFQTNSFAKSNASTPTGGTPPTSGK